MTSEKCLQAYKRCYSKCYRVLSSCPCVNNLEFELHPFLCIMLQISLVECDQSLWKGIYDYALQQIKPDQFSVFQSRIELYFAVVKGEYEPRAEWALGSPVDSNNLLMKPIIVFGDILVNPDCAADYKNAPICLQSIFDMQRFTLTYMQKVVPIIADEFSPLAPADPSSKKNPAHAVSIDSRTTISTPESRRRAQRVEQEQRKSDTETAISWLIAIAILLVIAYFQGWLL